MKIHFIAIGGSAMHNLALALHQKGYTVSGSDDEIFEPSRSRLQAAGLLPEQWGWFPEKVTPDLDAVILGMHARADNPELLKAREMGLKIYSYPEYLYEQTKNKKRVIIGGSHGKTTTTSMIMHVLRHCGVQFDYMVGALLEGFDTMVHLSEDSRIAVFEGDEYLSSPIDMQPKFHHYYPDIAVLTGIAWDHINVFPTFGNYVEQFAVFCERIAENGCLIYYEEDENIRNILSRCPASIRKIAYRTFPYRIQNGKTYLCDGPETELSVFGRHNLQNIAAAYTVCHELGIDDTAFRKAITSYKGAAKRLQTIAANEHSIAFLDFAHSPSKLKATLEAVRHQYPDKKLTACLELHTFSSLNADFLPQYKGCMEEADTAVVFFNPEVIRHKKLPEITPEDIRKGFGDNKLHVFTDNSDLVNYLSRQEYNGHILLIMTSGNFSGIDIKAMVKRFINE